MPFDGMLNAWITVREKMGRRGVRLGLLPHKGGSRITHAMVQLAPAFGHRLRTDPERMGLSPSSSRHPQHGRRLLASRHTDWGTPARRRCSVDQPDLRTIGNNSRLGLAQNTLVRCNSLMPANQA